MRREKVNFLIYEERERQDKLWGREVGVWEADPNRKMCVLTEEVGEVAKAINDHDYEEMKRELVQVAATAIAWLESID